MTADDYDYIVKLWTDSSGVGVNPDDSKENISKYLQRNPNTSFVAVEDDEIVGSILAGHDGYRGFIHHTAISQLHRGKGIGTKLVKAAIEAIRDEGINKVVLVVFKANSLGNSFWEKQGFAVREDLYYRDLRINNQCLQKQFTYKDLKRSLVV